MPLAQAALPWLCAVGAGVVLLLTAPIWARALIAAGKVLLHQLKAAGKAVEELIQSESRKEQ